MCEVCVFLIFKEFYAEKLHIKGSRLNWPYLVISPENQSFFAMLWTFFNKLIKIIKIWCTAWREEVVRHGFRLLGEYRKNGIPFKKYLLLRDLVVLWENIIQIPLYKVNDNLNILFSYIIKYSIYYWLISNIISKNISIVYITRLETKITWHNIL